MEGNDDPGLASDINVYIGIISVIRYKRVILNIISGLKVRINLDEIYQVVCSFIFPILQMYRKLGT